MALKIESVPLSGLLSLQQVVEFGSREMAGFFQQLLEDHKEGKIGTFYFKQQEIKLQKKVTDNNEVCDIIEKEIFKRLKSVFGNKATTPKIMTSLVADYEKEIEAHSKLAKDKSNPEVKTLKMEVSSEKKV